MSRNEGSVGVKVEESYRDDERWDNNKDCNAAPADVSQVQHKDMDAGQEFTRNPSNSIQDHPPLRNACDFCHSKRIKCRSTGGAKCQQCEHRRIECKFSVKEKTGPKPKLNVRGTDTSDYDQTVDMHSTHETISPVLQLSPCKNDSQNSSNMLKPVLLKSSLRPCPKGYKVVEPRIKVELKSDDQSVSMYAQSDWDAGKRREIMAFASKLTSPTTVAQEFTFLRTYLGTIARFLPMCDPQDLQLRMDFRKQLHNEISSGKKKYMPPLTYKDAELMAALSLGALVCNHPVNEDYQKVAQTLYVDSRGQNLEPRPVVAPLLCLIVFYWQYKGNIERKDMCLAEMRRNLLCEDASNSSLLLHLQLCMEHLDYQNMSENRFSLLPEQGLNLPARLRALDVISRVLRDLPILLDSERGLKIAKIYCGNVGECAVGVDEEEGNELPVLVCRALQTLLLILLGRHLEAVNTMSHIPVVLDSYPLIIRSMPLAWDMVLLAAAFAFALGLDSEYMTLYRAVEWAQNTTSSTHWNCRLPSRDCPLSLWVGHTCIRRSNSCMNVCTTVSEVIVRTNCGHTCFYSSETEVSNPPIPLPIPLSKPRSSNKKVHHATVVDEEIGQDGTRKLDKLASLASSYLMPKSNQQKRGKRKGTETSFDSQNETKNSTKIMETIDLLPLSRGTKRMLSPIHCGAPLSSVPGRECFGQKSSMDTSLPPMESIPRAEHSRMFNNFSVPRSSSNRIDQFRNSPDTSNGSKLDNRSTITNSRDDKDCESPNDGVYCR